MGKLIHALGPSEVGAELVTALSGSQKGLELELLPGMQAVAN